MISLHICNLPFDSPRMTWGCFWSHEKSTLGRDNVPALNRQKHGICQLARKNDLFSKNAQGIAVATQPCAFQEKCKTKNKSTLECRSQGISDELTGEFRLPRRPSGSVLDWGPRLQTTDLNWIELRMDATRYIFRPHGDNFLLFSVFYRDLLYWLMKKCMTNLLKNFRISNAVGESVSSENSIRLDWNSFFLLLVYTKFSLNRSEQFNDTFVAFQLPLLLMKLFCYGS